MASLVLSRVLQDIDRLDWQELASVERAVDERLATAGYSPEEWTAMQSLVHAGLMAEVKPRRVGSNLEYRPISIQGQPLSESIIEERR